MAIDDLGAQYYTLASLDDKLSNKAYVSKFRKWKKLVEFENGKDITGYTIYMGSRIRVCLFNNWIKRL